MLSTFYNELWNYLKQPNVIIGLALIIIGLVCVILSARIVRTVRKVDVVENNDRMLLAIRIVGLVLMIIGFVVIFMLSPVWLRLMLMGAWWGIAPAVVYLIIHLSCWAQLKSKSGSALNPLLGGTARAMLIFTVLFAVALVCSSYFCTAATTTEWWR